MLQSKANSNLLNSQPQKEESSQKDRKKALRLTKKKKTAKKKESLETKSFKLEKERRKAAVKPFHPTTRKTSIMKESDTNTERLKEKRELAAKAKKKFLDNLTKFQKESRVAGREPFSRDQTRFERQSLRKPQFSETTKNLTKSNPVRNSLGKGNIKRKPSTENNHAQSNHDHSSVTGLSDNSHKLTSSSDPLETESFVIFCDTMTSLRPSSAASSTMKSSSSTLYGPQRPKSRAEVAMEKHRERMRKASQQMTTHNAVPQPSRQQLTPKMKRRNQPPDISRDDVVSSSAGKQIISVRDHPENVKKDEIKLNSVKTNSNKKSSMAAWQSIKVIEENHNSLTSIQKARVEEQNSFDLLDIRSPMIKRKNPNRGNRKQKAASRVKQRPAHRNGSSTNNQPESLSHSGFFEDTVNHIKSTTTESVVAVRKNSFCDTNESTAEFQLGNQVSNGLETLDFRQRENEQATEEWVNQQQILISQSQAPKAKNNDITRARKLSQEQQSDVLNASAENQHEKNDNNILPEEPLVFNISSPQAIANHAHDRSTKSRTQSNDSTSSTISGITSEKKETNKRNGAKKKTKNDTFSEVHFTSQPDETAKSVEAAADLYLRTSESFEVDEKNGLLRETLILDYKPSRHKRTNSAPTKRSVEETMSVVAPVTSRSFRLLSASQRREKLRKVLLKYRKESDSDSPFSEGSGDESDIDIKWLEDGNDSTSSGDIDKWINSAKTAKRDTNARKILVSNQPQCNGTDKTPTSNNDNSHHGSHPSEPPSIGNMKSMWESKATETYKPRSTVDSDLEGVKNKVQATKAALISPTRASTIKECNSSFQERQQENGNTENETIEPRNVSSMLSMWENRKEKKHSAFNATKDEAFDSNTMGRLQGAKALFHRMSITKKDRPATAPVQRKRTNVKDVFENKSSNGDTSSQVSPAKKQESPDKSSVELASSPTIKSNSTVSLETASEEDSNVRINPKKSSDSNFVIKKKRSRELSSGDWLEGESDLSDEACLSSSTTSEDESETTKVKNVSTSRERKSSQKSRKASTNSMSRKISEQEVHENKTSAPTTWSDSKVH